MKQCFSCPQCGKGSPREYREAARVPGLQSQGNFNCLLLLHHNKLGTFLQIFELQKRFESAREQIKQLPGIDYNKEEQQQRLELLRSQLKLKQQLIRKYKGTEF